MIYPLPINWQPDSYGADVNGATLEVSRNKDGNAFGITFESWYFRVRFRSLIADGIFERREDAMAQAESCLAEMLKRSETKP